MQKNLTFMQWIFNIQPFLQNSVTETIVIFDLECNKSNMFDMHDSNMEWKSSNSLIINNTMPVRLALQADHWGR